jgi:IS5 family transposase
MGKVSYSISNWRRYNAGLKKRGSLTLWISSELLKGWRYSGVQKRGGCKRYSDLAIETCLTVRLLYHLPLRQTEGFVESLFILLRLPLPVPDYSTLCRRSEGLAVNLRAPHHQNISDIVVDATGLKLYGEGEWKVRTHGWYRHRTWMKLHVALRSEDQQIEAVVLTTNAVDDGGAVEPLLTQIPHRIRSFTADAAYDQHKVRRRLFEDHIRQVIVPTPKAIADEGHRDFLRQRDRATADIAQKGQAQWKRHSGYHRRSLIETTMFRYKTIVGDHLRARTLTHQQSEVRVGCKILNLMLQVAKPQSKKAA